MKKIKIQKIFDPSIFEISLAGLFIALWTISAAYIKIDFGLMRAGVYLAFAILTGLIFKPVLALIVAIISDNLQLLLAGAQWSWLFALLPIIIVFTTIISKQILKIKRETTWNIATSVLMIAILVSILTLLILNKNFSHSDQGKLLNFSSLTTQALIWTFFAIFTLAFISLYWVYWFKRKNKKSVKNIKKMINITLIVSFVYIIASWIIGPIATIIWLNQIGGTMGFHDKHTSYYWKMYEPYTIIRIIKTPVSLPIHIIIVYGIYNVYEIIKKQNYLSWKK